MWIVVNIQIKQPVPFYNSQLHSKILQKQSPDLDLANYPYNQFSYMIYFTHVHPWIIAQKRQEESENLLIIIINFCDCMVYMVIQVEILILDNVESKQKSKLSHLFWSKKQRIIIWITDIIHILKKEIWVSSNDK